MTPLSALAFAAAQETHDAMPGEYGDGALWQDSSFWVLVVFLLVVAGIWRAGLHKKLAVALDARAQRIADELDHVRRLREEAQELLATYQRRQRDAEEEARGIIEQAKKDAQRLSQESRTKIAELIERRAKAAEDKIARAEAQALAEVRAQTVDLAIETAREIIRNRMDQGAQAALIERAIGDLRAKMN